MKTAARIQAPTALMVGLETDIGGLCFAYFDEGGMRILASRDVATACTRISEVMPVVVVAARELSPQALHDIEEHAAAVGAQLVLLSRGESKTSIHGALAGAMARVGTR